MGSRRQAGVSYRSYGEFMNLHASELLPASTLVKSLQGHFDPDTRGLISTTLMPNGPIVSFRN